MNHPFQGETRFLKCSLYTVSAQQKRGCKSILSWFATEFPNEC